MTRENDKTGAPRLTFEEFATHNPCDGCPAPCCRVQLSPLPVPQTFLAIDYVRYLLLFPGTECVVNAAGEWSQVRWQNCSAFDADCQRCALHGTPAKPRTCTEYNAYSCWYASTFSHAGSPEVYRLDRARFEVWVQEIVFDAHGRILDVPGFERSQQLLRDLPIEPVWDMQPRAGESTTRPVPMTAPAAVSGGPGEVTGS